MKKQIVLVCLFALFLSCKEREKAIVDNQKSDTLNIDLAEIKNFIKLQKNANYIDYRPDNPYLHARKDYYKPKYKEIKQ